MIVYLLFALVPAMLIAAVGVYIRSKVSAQDATARWLQFLFLTTVLSLCLTMLLSYARIDVAFLVMPAATGLLAAFLLSLADRRFWSLPERLVNSHVIKRVPGHSYMFVSFSLFSIS
jgi:hypothetical protein